MYHNISFLQELIKPLIPKAFEIVKALLQVDEVITRSFSNVFLLQFDSNIFTFYYVDFQLIARNISLGNEFNCYTCKESPDTFLDFFSPLTWPHHATTVAAIVEF